MVTLVQIWANLTPHRWLLLVCTAWLIGVGIVMAATRNRFVQVVPGEIELKGTVADIVDQRGIRQTIRVKVPGERQTIQAQVGGYPALHIGDRIAVTCELQGIEGLAVEAFRYDRYLRKERVAALCRSYATPKVIERKNSWRARLFSTRDHVEGSLQQYLHEPHASLLIGLLYGARSTLPDDIQEAFRRSGTMHIVAVSGYNVLLVSSALLYVLSLFLRRQRSLAIVLLCIAAFAMLAGADAAVVRAAMMGGLVLVARHIGRPAQSPVLLLLAATVMTAVNPHILFDDAGFHLSFAAAAGLIWLAPHIRQRLRGYPKLLRSILSETTAATAMTSPILWLQFGQLSLVALISNLFVLPLIPFAVGFGLLGIGGSLLADYLPLDWLGVASVFPAYLVLDLMLTLIRLFAALPWLTVS